MSDKKLNRRTALKAGGLLASSLAVGKLSYGANKNIQASDNKNEVVFITGGARGIGLATAEVFAKSGVHVVIFDVVSQVEGVQYPLATLQDLQQAKNKIESYGVKCLTIKGDVRSTEQLNEAVS